MASVDDTEKKTKSGATAETPGPSSVPSDHSGESDTEINVSEYTGTENTVEQVDGISGKYTSFM